uniref:AlNc14C77G5142 protein n=1 Tax=Albugo laibachii Nc14 TaxID=890382 RepID=F0WEU2_9STRA|nr:AlNc14C77G5142 [Albugo laibachii Nc14]|eukprot:CCA19724.1 AlNc14C77G5142 [Albugo laibachii Nc14]
MLTFHIGAQRFGIPQKHYDAILSKTSFGDLQVIFDLGKGTITVDLSSDAIFQTPETWVMGSAVMKNMKSSFIKRNSGNDQSKYVIELAGKGAERRESKWHFWTNKGK